MIPSRRPTTYLRALLLGLIPEVLYLFTFFILAFAHGGHHNAILGINTKCSIPHKPHVTNQVPRVVLQITDLHSVSNPGATARSHIRAFEHEVFPIWASYLSAVIVTGDLVEASVKNRFVGKHSYQSYDEWGPIDKFLLRLNRSVPVFVVHGNHDTFGGHIRDNSRINVSEVTAPSHGPPQHPRAIIYRLPDSQLNLIAVDSTAHHTLHRPINFFGDARQSAKDLDDALDSISDVGNVLVFGHYPSTITIDSLRIQATAYAHKNARPRFSAYISGHLHDFMGYAPNGLSSVSKSGALELETPDMIRNGAYRLIVFDGDTLSTTVSRLNNSQFLHDIVVLSLPRAGLCPSGAGAVALQTSHIRVLSPRVDLESAGVSAIVDGIEIGPMRRQRRHHLCNAPICKHLYEVSWDPTMFKHGTHTLILRTGKEQSEPYLFSLDGTPSPTRYNLYSALLTLSDTETIFIQFCTAGLALSLALCVVGVSRRSLPSFVLFLGSAAILLGAPLLVSWRLNNDVGFGYIGLRSIVLPSGTSFGGGNVDVAFYFGRYFVWASLLPICFIHAATLCGWVRGLKARNVLVLAMGLYTWRSLSWTLELGGAYGLAAAVFSLAGLPMVVATLWVTLSTVKRLGGRKDEVTRE